MRHFKLLEDAVLHAIDFLLRGRVVRQLFDGADEGLAGIIKRLVGAQPGRGLEHVIKSAAHWCQKLTPLTLSLRS